MFPVWASLEVDPLGQPPRILGAGGEHPYVVGEGHRGEEGSREIDQPRPISLPLPVACSSKQVPARKRKSI